MRFARQNALDDPILQEGDTAFVRMNTRLRPDQLQPGEVALSENGRMETDNHWRPRPPIIAKSGALLDVNLTRPITYDADSAGALTLIADTTITAAALASNVVTVTAASHGIPSGHTSIININGVAFVTTDPNGNREVTYVDDDNFTFPLTGGNETYTITSGELARSFVIEAAQTEVFASCILSDPSDDNEEYLIIATDSEARGYKLSSGTTPLTEITIDYPAGELVSGPAEMVQAFDKVFLWRKGDTAMEWAFDISGGSHAFTVVSSGTYTDASRDEVAESSTTVGSDGKVSFSVTSHGLSQGDKVVVTVAGAGLTAGDEYTITKDDADNFHFYADIDDAATGAPVTVRKKVSVAGGWSHMPGAEWGVYHQRRFWMPYTHTSADPPVDREVVDELIASDILDPGTFDPIQNQFRITGGRADHIVAVHPFAEDNLIVGCRNSIHIVSGISGSLTDATARELTREAGVVARKSFVTYESNIFFLSDNGVYSLEFIDEYNLRGTALPLSESIQTYIDRINPEYAHMAVAVIHDNKYHLAVPLDNATQNTHILVYSFLNGGWESVDFTGSENFGIKDFHTARRAKVNELWMVSTLGGAHLLEEGNINIYDRIIDTIADDDDGSPFYIASEFLSRQYNLGQVTRKKWNRLDIQLKSGEGNLSDGAISFEVADPDSTTALGDASDYFGAGLAADEDGSLRTRTGNQRGYGAQIRFTPSTGRPAIRLIRVEGMVDFRSTTTVT